MLDESVIPKGTYCDGCPYWRHRSEIDNKEVNEYNFGYCLYLGKGDLEINSEKHWRRVYTKEDGTEAEGELRSADDEGMFFSLLWDGCKECQINDDYDEEHWDFSGVD